MPDNISVDNSIEPGSVDVKTEVVDGIHYPWIKVAFGSEGEIPTPVDRVNGLPVHLVEGYDTVVNELLHLHTGVSSTIAVATSSGDTSIEVADGSVFTIGSPIQISDGSIESTFPVITNIATNVLTLDRPLDFAFDIGDDVEEIHTDLSTTIGTLSAPISHKAIADVGTGIWHISRIMISMTHSTAADDAKFGNQLALANGVVLRANISGQNYTFTNWKSNGDLKLDMYDVTYTDKAGPSLHGTSGRGSFNRIGVVIRLDPANGDYLEALVQDDLTGLSSFFIKAQGHIEPA